MAVNLWSESPSGLRCSNASPDRKAIGTRTQEPSDLERALYVKMFDHIAKSPSGCAGARSGGHSVGAMTSRATDQTNLAASLGSLGLLVFSMFLVPLRDFLGAANVAIILLLGVQVVAIIGGRGGGILAAIVAALSFDFFFTEPYLRLVITDRHDIITAVLLLVAGIATRELGALRVRRELGRSRDPTSGGPSSSRTADNGDQSPESPLVRRWKGTLVTAMPVSAARIPLMASRSDCVGVA